MSSRSRGGGGRWGLGGLREEVERLRRDLSEAREQQAATSGVLAVLGRATLDLDAVLETVVDSARHLCRADTALIFLLEGDAYRLAIASGALTEEDRAYLDQHPLAQDRGSLAGRVGLERRPQQIADVLADPEYGRLDIQRHGGFRTTMGVPMLLDGEVVGVLIVWRTRVDPFSERATELPDHLRHPGGDCHPQRRPGQRPPGPDGRGRGWPAGTSRNSWPACRTSCGPRSTPSSGSPRCCWSGCSATSTTARRSTSATSGAPASTCWSC